MELNGFDLFAFFLCSGLFGILLSAWATTDFIADREVSLLIVVFAILVSTLFFRLSSAKAVINYISRHTTEIQDKQIADMKEAHRRRVAALKYEHQMQHHQLQANLNTANVKFDRLYSDHDWISGMYQDQMRSIQEQEHRIAYLEVKLQEFGQRTPGAHMPFSAPSSQISFSNPPRRNRSTMRSPVGPSPLAQVVEVDEE
ncbi:uncharacterized protein K460DRAFT_341182 [Cucurbitaria berberidis CBS 394.84]|uniref:Uncharacterized protein n=1 Tax=Cucurbitaria berberidis CBS 394.84 TaxID=1168544 RepID=A0A9P4L6G0_9PLEO|nr:uncharacterized protein K460DRAFT_341182 [Cucurbitaria berberidis CBS 394.84]KAF1843259.1 hypothetical protein K460DRAFT_341182 [Cucurbitaria berberidis CBS 394.84]